jgi:hypothetical protein
MPLKGLKVVKRETLISNEIDAKLLIQNKITEYDVLRGQKKAIEDRMKILAPEIKEYAGEHGVKDANGSYYIEIGGFMTGKQAKKKVTFLKDEAIKFFKKKKLLKAIQVVENINETEVEKYINEGLITVEDLESITETKTEYAIDVKKVEEIPEIEQINYKAASAKPSLPKARK